MTDRRLSSRKLVLMLVLLLMPFVLITAYVGAYFTLSSVSVPAQPYQNHIRVFSSRTLVTFFQPLHWLESRHDATTEIGWIDEKANVIRTD